VAARAAVWTAIYVLHDVVMVVHGWHRAHDYLYANYDEGECVILDWRVLMICM